LQLNASRSADKAMGGPIVLVKNGGICFTTGRAKVTILYYPPGTSRRLDQGW
jgi:hypothetical protein